MSATVITVENLSKYYRLGVIGGATFREEFSRWWARRLGRPDPYAKIGQKDDGNRDGEYIWALRDINLEVKEGEILGVIGRNGAGKSTLLKILSRITAPTAGRAVIRGRVGSLLEVGTGFHPELTGRENIYLNGTLLGMKCAEVDRKLDEIVAFAEIEPFIDTPVKRYSSGMTVRLAFAVAAHLEPEILIVDEVLAVGDAAFQKKCLGRMNDIAGHGRTVLFVSHNMGAIKRLCSRALFLSNGTIDMSGSAGEVAGCYLEKSFDKMLGGGRVIWSAEKAPGSDEIQLVSCTVRGMETNRYGMATTEENIEIETTYNQTVKLTGARIVLTFLSSSGEIAFASTDHEQRRGHSYSAGVYKSFCRIPARLLNQGVYHLQLRVGIPGMRTLIPDKDVCRFLIEGYTAHGSTYDAGWPGVVCPELVWQVEKISSNA